MMSKNAEIEAQILEVAYRFFIQHGYRNTTMDAIASELSMSKKTLYKYFPGKLELLGAAFMTLKTRLATKVSTLLENPHIPYVAKFKALLSAVATDVSSINPKILDELRDHAPEVWTELLKYIRESGYLRFQKLILEGISQGYVNPEVNVSFVVFIYTSAIQSLIDHRFLSQFPEEMRVGFNLSPAEIYDHATQVIYMGILTDEGRKEFSTS